MEVYEKKIPVSVTKGDLRVEVGNKLSYSDDPKADLLKRPLNFHNYNESRLEGLYQSAEREEKGRITIWPWKSIWPVCSAEPCTCRALTPSPSCIAAGRVPEGPRIRPKAVGHVMYDPMPTHLRDHLPRHG